MDRLDKSLDELISSTPRDGGRGRGKGRVGGGGGGGGRGGRGKGRQSDRSAGAIRGNQFKRNERQASQAPYQTSFTVSGLDSSDDFIQSTHKATVFLARKPIVKSVQPVASKAPVPVFQQSRQPSQQQSQPKNSSSIFDRLGNPQTQATPIAFTGTRVTVSNLNSDITASEVAELYGSVGEIQGTEMKFDRFGSSIGVVEVVFARRSDAIASVTKFHGVTLDGSPMDVKLTEEIGREHTSGGGIGGYTTGAKIVKPFRAGGFQSNNVREGLFGTAADLDEDNDEQMVVEDRGYSSSNSRRGGAGLREPVFSITLHGSNDNGGGGRRPNSAGGGDISGRRVNASSANASGSGGRSRARGGGGRGSRDGAGKTGGTNSLSGSSLDADLDAYFSKK